MAGVAGLEPAFRLSYSFAKTAYSPRINWCFFNFMKITRMKANEILRRKPVRNCQEILRVEARQSSEGKQPLLVFYLCGG
jgi:hypothetical protein